MIGGVQWWRWVITIASVAFVAFYPGWRDRRFRREMADVYLSAWWSHFLSAWAMVGAHVALDCLRARDDAEDVPGALHGNTMSGVHLIAGRREGLLIIRGKSVGQFSWSTRRELAETLRGLAVGINVCADYADAPASGISPHPIDREDASA